MDKLKLIIKTLPYEVILLKLLRYTNNEDIREYILKNNFYDRMPVGYIYKILQYYDINTLHLFKIEDDYFINNNYYDYYVKYEQILPIVDKELTKLSNDYIQSINDALINSKPEYLLIQEYDPNNENETDVMNDIISKNPKSFNIRKYLKNKQINFNKYKIEGVVLTDRFYFIENDEKYIYKDGKIEKSDWNLTSKVILSIYKLV